MHELLQLHYKFGHLQVEFQVGPTQDRLTTLGLCLLLPAKLLAFLPTDTEQKIWRLGLEEIERWLLFLAGREEKRSRLMPQELCPVPHEESRGL